MAHHKRKRPKNRRSGCLTCKPHKMNGAKDKRQTAQRRMLRRDLDESQVEKKVGVIADDRETVAR